MLALRVSALRTTRRSAVATWSTPSWPVTAATRRDPGRRIRHVKAVFGWVPDLGHSVYPEPVTQNSLGHTLRFSFALLHEASLSGARQPLAVPVDRFTLTGVPPAFFKKLALAAPTSGLPYLLMALLSQASCADA